MAAATQQWILQGLNHAQAGRLQQAEQCYRQVLAFDPNPTTRILLAGLVPPVYLSMQELTDTRTKLVNQFSALKRDGVSLDVTGQYAVPEFFVTYQGLNDRDLQKLRASLYRAPREMMLPSKRRGERIRVGLASAHFRDHTIGRLNMGLIAQLDPKQFDVTVFVTGPQKGDLAEFIRDHAESYIELPNDLNYSRRIIAGQKLDVLFYTDLGMEPVTYTLALTRLAPVQCATWGHPVTSGIDAVDYFISSEALEPEGSEDHYTEKLVRLPTLAVYYYRPWLAAAPSRAALNLPEDATLYGCPQSLYKIHPEFDPILAGILRGDPKGLLVLLKGNHVEWEQRLMLRFGQSMPDVVSRIRWAPRQDRNGYLNLVACMDVSLDPIHFGGGNTSYEAIALGVPIVTLPSGFMRGRLTYAMYTQMNLPDCIVHSQQQYIDTALRLGTDRDYRQQIREKIKAADPAIFESRAAVENLENFFRQAVEERRG